MSILNKLIKETNKIDFLFPNSFEQLMNSEYYDYDKFEWFLYYVFKMDDSSVKKIGKKGQGDGGADLIISKITPDRGVRRIGIQAKYWKNKVGTAPINQLASARSRHDLTDLWIITTSDLTSDAKEIAESMDIKILRADDVKNLIEHVKKQHALDIENDNSSPIQFLVEDSKKSNNNLSNKQFQNKKEISVKDKDLFETLRKLRTEIAKEHNIQPVYLIYNNNMIDDLIKHKPQTLDALLKVNGFGDKKVTQFGQAIIDVFINKPTIKKSPDTNVNSLLYKKLLKERTRIAKYNKLKPTEVYSDEVAANIAKQKPTTIKELSAISGFNQKNINIFGNYLVVFIKKNI